MSNTFGNNGSTSPDYHGFTREVITSYSKTEVLGRIEDVVSGGYSGELGRAWQAVEFLPPAEARQIEFDDSRYADVARKTAIRVKNAGLSSVAIEAAHAYMYESTDDPNLLAGVRAQARQAGLLRTLLTEEGITTTQVLFIDDYNPDPKDGKMKFNLDTNALREIIAESGFAPDVLVREAGMVELAKEIIRIMDEEQGLVVRELGPGGLDQFLARRKVELFRQAGSTVSCAMLDSALTILKLGRMAEGVVNVLPTSPAGQTFSYNGQQRKMRTITGEHMGIRVLPVFNMFVTPDDDSSNAYGSHHILRKPRV